MADAENGGAIGAVTNSITILETIVDLGGAPLKDLDEEISLSKSTIHNHLQTLAEIGYVKKTGNEYTIGMGCLKLGGYVRDNHVLYDVARQPVNQIAEESGELALLNVEHGGMSTYLYQAKGNNAVTTDSYLGIQLPMYCTGSGKAMLSQMDESRVESILDEETLEPYTSNTITEYDALMDELERIREANVAFDDEERITGMRGIAAPVTNRNSGAVVGAVSLTGPTTRVRGELYREELPELIRRVSDMIEVNFTYSE